MYANRTHANRPTREANRAARNALRRARTSSRHIHMDFHELMLVTFAGPIVLVFAAMLLGSL